ncbi:hypothetical protein V6R85_23905 [Agrobacterium sp. CCNWLW32]|uniref:hypothetical protein n=1 Tax=Agrobacterium sp. CCNWLW32 TaxID=3122072 RepID=UPI00300FD2E5
MSDADKPWSAPPAGSSSEGSPAPSSIPTKPACDKAPVSADEDLRASFAQWAEEYRRKQDAERKAAEQGQGQSMGMSLPTVPVSNPASSSLQDGGPVAPDFSDMFKHFDEVERGAQEQIQGQRDKDQREADAAYAVSQGETALMNAIVAGIARGEKSLSESMRNAAIEAGYRQHEGEVNSGASQLERTEDAGWREFHQTEQRGFGQLDRSETAGERQHETEERRRSSGMSL